MKQTDFIAELEFFTTEKSGRKSPAHSGYRPHIEFEHYPEYLTSGQQTYIEQEVVELGTKVKAEIAILGTEYFSKRLYVNMKFKFCEGSHIIGTGKIIDITNTDLISEPNIEQKSINLNLYPTDIRTRLESDFGKNYNQVFWRIQELIISNTCFQINRIIRAIIHLLNRDLEQLERIIGQAKTDWRDILFWAEYDENENRIRDFNNEFGKENIKASR